MIKFKHLGCLLISVMKFCESLNDSAIRLYILILLIYYHHPYRKKKVVLPRMGLSPAIGYLLVLQRRVVSFICIN